MKAIILPTTNTVELAPLTSWDPEFLLPIVNKPIVEHLIELLARHHIQEILLIIKHMPYETEMYFGDGSRWGVHISYFLLGSYRGIVDALGRIEASKLEGSFLCLSSDLVTDIDISEFVNFQQQNQGDACLAIADADHSNPNLKFATAEELEKNDYYPLILTDKILKVLSKYTIPDIVSDESGQQRQELGIVNTYHSHFSYQRVKSLADLATVNRRILAGNFKSILIPGKLAREGFLLGRNCHLHPAARLEAPLLIGNHCNIQGGTSIGPGSIIGDQVIIDEGALVQDSLVLNHTYVGAHTEIKDAILKKNWMFQIHRMLHVHLSDDLILGDLEKKTLATKGDRLLNLVIAWIVLILTSPLWVMLLFYHLIFPKKSFLFSEKRLRASGRMNLDGKTIPQTFDLFFFRTGNRFIRKLPGLIHVILGDVNLVGISPLNEEAFRLLPEAWREMRVNAPLGMFHLWELDARDDLEWEEKMVMESYYAATRSIWWDMKIFSKAFFRAIFH